MKVKCKVIKKVFSNGDFYIFGCSPIVPYPNVLKLNKFMSFTIKGELSYLSEGKEYNLEIEELSTDKYGTSYKVVSCDIKYEDLENLTYQDSYDILTEITTDRLATNILKAYPNFIWQVLTNGKDSIDVNNIYGVGDAYLNAYVRELNTKYKYLNIMNKFKEYSLEIADCKALVNEFVNEEEIRKALQDNPYHCLIDILGRTFEKTDKLLMEIRQDLKVSEQRCAYLILSVLRRSEEDGDTRLNGGSLYNYILDEYNVPELEPLIVPTAMNNDLFFYDEETTDLSIMETYLGECKIADLVKEKISNPHQLDIDCEQYRVVDGFALTDQQFELLTNFCKFDFTILKGVAGAGKTSSVKALVKLMEDNNLSYTLVTPTGASALRVTEQTNRKASTIHRKVLKDGEINSDVIIVDEMSMVGLDVFLMLINAIVNDKCKIVLCGDDSQLPSIQKGRVFNDLITSNVIPTANLTKVFRYDTSGGAFVGENIRNGRKFLNNEKVKHDGNVHKIFGNYKFVESTNDKIFDEIIKEYARLRKTYSENEIIILSPFNKGDCGTYKINETIENEYNPPRKNELSLSYTKDGVNIIFRVGSKVVNTKNDYKAMPLESYKKIEESNGLLTEDDVELTQLYNGQIGTVREVTDNYLVCQFDEELIVINKIKLYNLLLARAISTHRSQGGEWKSVINVVSPMHERLLSKQLLYVSNTRAKEFHCDIGSVETLENSLLVDTVATRNTWLKELLTN